MQIQYRGRTLQGRHKRIGHVSQSQVFVFEHDAFTLDGLLPRGITRRIAPSWDLPRKLVVKHYCNEDEKDRDLQAAYSTEVAAYRQMAPIQGCTVPRFYGPVVVDGGDCPAIAVEFLDGVTVWDLCVPGCPAATYCDPDAVSSGITQCFSDISSCGVVQSDCEFDKLDSLMYVGQPKRYLLPAVVAMLTTAIWLPLWLTTMLCVCALVFCRMLPAEWLPVRDRVCMIDFGYIDFEKDCPRVNLAFVRLLIKTFRRRFKSDWL